MIRERLRGQVGNWVAGETFWDRDAEVRQLRQHLEDGQHVMIIAPRRVGKTSLMREVARRLDDDFYAIFVDVEDCQNPTDAIVAISKQTRSEGGLWVKTREAFRDMVDAFKGNFDSLNLAQLSVKFSDATLGRWRERGGELLAALADADKPVVLFIDELPILVNRVLEQGTGRITDEGRHEADVFLSWFRAQAQQHQSKLRFVVSGSIGFGPVLGRANLSAATNHLVPFHLDAWDAQTARQCLGALAKHRGLRFVDGAEQEVVELLGLCIPHHVQAIFDLLYGEARRDGRDIIDPFDVRQVYQQKMLSSRGHSELKHYEERLSMVLDDELFPLAVDMLTEAALSPQGLSSEAARRLWKDTRGEGHDAGGDLRTIFEILEHDGYLERDAGRWRFRSNLLQDWWKARFEAFYVPVADREA